MSQGTSIEWTDATWNPVRGCSRVSEACRHCYAEKIAGRFSGKGQKFEGFATGGQRDYHGSTGVARTNGTWRWTGRVELVPSKLDEPLRWRKPRKVFVNSMSDLFHEALPNEDIEHVFAVMALATQHTFQVLTKRPRRMLEWFSSGVPGLETREEDVLRAAEWRGKVIFDDRGSDRYRYPPGSGDVSDRRRWPGWPLPNVWLGVSVEDQATADERIPLLLQTPAAVRFVSYEPALGAVDFLRLGKSAANPTGWSALHSREAHVRGLYERGLDWVISGGESGPGARPFDIAWARSVVEQCRTAGVACFVKQLGARPMMRADSLDGRRAGDHPEREWPYGIHFGTAPGHMGTEWQGRLAMLGNRKGGDTAEWPEDLRVREFPRVTP